MLHRYIYYLHYYLLSLIIYLYIYIYILCITIVAGAISQFLVFVIPCLPCKQHIQRLGCTQPQLGQRRSWNWPVDAT